MRGWTQGELATRLGTTAATISRLETADMSVSVDWLQKFADAFHIHPTDLLEAPDGRQIPMLGDMSAKGLQSTPGALPDQTIELKNPAARPVAVTLTENIGPYRAGETLIADRQQAGSYETLMGKDCLVGVDDDHVLLRRLIKGEGESITLVPYEEGDEITYDVVPRWVARIVMAVRTV